MVKSGSVDHIALSVSDFEKSKQFYEYLLVDCLGFKVIMDQPTVVMYNLAGGYTIGVSPGNHTPHRKHNPGLHHLAMASETKEEVDALFEKISAFYSRHEAKTMGHILDEPAAYPQYSPKYYAVFFTDPDGVKLEFAFR